MSRFIFAVLCCAVLSGCVGLQSNRSFSEFAPQEPAPRYYAASFDAFERSCAKPVEVATVSEDIEESMIEYVEQSPWFWGALGLLSLCSFCWIVSCARSE